jgi:putative addiction module killer protein
LCPAWRSKARKARQEILATSRGLCRDIKGRALGWFDRIDRQAAAKVATAVARLSLGNTSNVKWFSGIGELRIDWGLGYRVYLAKDGETLVLLFCGGTKKRQQADIATAMALHAEYKVREKMTTRKAR